MVVSHGNQCTNALAYAKKGWSVIPLNGKIPHTPNGSKDCTRDEEVIKGWFRKWTTANVGICTGSVSKLWVIDVDGEVGLESLKGLVQTYGSDWIKKTRTANTGNNGYHFYFTTELSLPNTAKLLPGIDTRGEGGYVVSPNSIHPDTNKAYTWREGPSDPSTPPE